MSRVSTYADDLRSGFDVLPSFDVHPSGHRAPSRQPWRRWCLPICGVAIGVRLLVVAYGSVGHIARGETKYVLFWAALLAIFGPIAARLAGRSAGTVERWLLVCLLGVATYLPKLLRSPGRPSFIDELLNFNQISRLAASHHLLVPSSIVPVLADYPALDVAVVALHSATGLPLWWSALVVVGAAHLALLLAVFRLAAMLSDDDRTAGVAALVYAAGPGFLFFTTQVAYESLGISFAAWALVLALLAAERVKGSRMCLCGAVLLISLTAVTHHVSAIFLSLTLGLLAFTHWRKRVPTARTRLLTQLFVYSTVVTSGWIALHGWSVIAYVLPTTTQIQGFVPGGGGPVHHAFAGSSLPAFERLSGYLTPPIVLVLLGVGYLNRKRLRRCPPVANALLIISVCYLVSLPLLISANGLVWAHRSWPFLYLAMAPIVATGALRLVDAKLRWRSLAVSGAALAGIMSMVMFVGNTANSVNEAVQFPVPDVLGAQSGSTTPQMLAASAWLESTAGPGARLVSDPNTAANMVLYAKATFVRQFPTWWLTFVTGSTDPRVVSQLQADDVQWLIVDRRMYTQVSLTGTIYNGNEPGAYAHTAPLPSSAWQSLTQQAWAHLAYSNSQIAIFHVQVAS
jgi:hypothetical protein